MRSGKHKEAFKILSLFHIDMPQTTVRSDELSAARLLAELYEYGQGVVPDLAQALSLYNYCSSGVLWWQAIKQGESARRWENMEKPWSGIARYLIGMCLDLLHGKETIERKTQPTLCFPIA